ncbi:tigger transposable element-derived protein 1-like [Homarus americanus]|uniref:tigger transposable element-derived protein 1-like n=1 Tax=Homarus americanus TaxID=6706 RepID=UPI001C46B1EE|nr:tigger transposable element-derived protein 1-like [Homarus americanus]
MGITLETKLDVLRRLDQGEKLSYIAKTLGLATSNVGTIRDNKDKIWASAKVATPLSACTLYFHCSNVMIKMEHLLSVWIEDQTRQNVPINSMMIQEKAKSLHAELIQEEGASSDEKQLNASKGFEHFKKHSNLHNNKMVDDVASADTEAASNYPAELKAIIEGVGYTPQVYNIDETGFFWKHSPARTYISNEEKTPPGLKASKDCVTLLLGGNVARDFKIKSMLVYHSENPRAFKGCAISRLPVIWHG